MTAREGPETLVAATERRRRPRPATETGAPKTATPRARKPKAARVETEKAFQRRVEANLRALGWWVFSIPDSRRATARGLPDVLALHPKRRVLLAWEFKRQAGRTRPEQIAVLHMLTCAERIDARIVRPADWDALQGEVTR